jgi:short subunit dehydrogenase-like uncharacterized protein
MRARCPVRASRPPRRLTRSRAPAPPRIRPQGTPFIDKALPIVELCTRHGTCYTDITGETPLHRASYDKFHDAAKASGAIVLHGCGFDSVPSDMGAFLAAKAMRTKHGCACSLIKTFYGDSAGFVSGGTLATVVALMSEGDNLPGAKEAKARGSYSLDPRGATGGPDTNDHGSGVVAYDQLAKTWVAPFVMAAVNAPVVRKSNALSGYSYGQHVRYAEVMSTGSLSGSVLSVLGLAAFGAALFVSPLRWLLLRVGAMPKPGEGPSKAQQDTGYFKTAIYAVGEAGKEALVCKVHFNSGTAGDPGYKATALMSIESSLALALQRDECSAEGGVLTTATALGDVLIARLNKAGMDVGIDY